jgi:hypothetical protein
MNVVASWHEKSPETKGSILEVKFPQRTNDGTDQASRLFLRTICNVRLDRHAITVAKPAE